MGIFKKIFKKVGNVFKGIGKTIKKGFMKFGKFMNKLGILGQIGMMFIMPGIAGFAMKGLMQMGSGFMTGLASAGWTTTAAGVTSATSGVIGGVARVSHAVLSTVAKVAQTGMNAYRTITDTVMGVVTDTAKAIGQKMGMNVAVPNISAVTGLPMDAAAQGAANAGSILENAAARFQAGTAKTWASLTDTAKVVGDIMPGGADYIPKYENIGEVDKFGKLKFRQTEVNYSTKNRDAFNAAANKLPDVNVETGRPPVSVDSSATSAVNVAEKATEPSAGFFTKERLTDATRTAITQQGYQFMNAKGEVVDYSQAVDPIGQTADINYFTNLRGSGQTLAGTGFNANETNSESTDFYGNVLNTESYLNNMPFVQNMYEDFMQKNSINGGRGQFAGSYTA